MTQENPKKAALYIRTSTDNQKESIKLQSEQLTTFCDSHNIEIFDKYIDFGFSGKNNDRPQFKRMMMDAEEKEFNIVLVTKIDRFARSIIDCLVSIEKLQENGIEFRAIHQPIDTGNSMGKLFLTFMAAFADFERTVIRERMEAGRKAAEKRGVQCHRPRAKISKSAVLGMLEKKQSANTIAKELGHRPSTIVKRLNEWGYHYYEGKWVHNSVVPRPEEEIVEDLT